jgi:hypothetical protein
VSPEAKKSGKYWAVLTALMTIFNISDDLRFLFGTLHKYRDILTYMVLAMINPSIFWFIFDMVMPAEMFLAIAGGMQATLVNKLAYFVMGLFGLTPLLTGSIECRYRVKWKALYGALFKKLPMTLIKLVLVLLTGRTIGFLDVFTLAKSYILFCKGVGECVAFILDEYEVTNKA